MISNEAVAPYERPALSKAYLSPPNSTNRARLPGFHTCVGTGSTAQDAAWYKKHGIELLLSTEATELQYKQKKVLARSLNSTELYEIAYRKLIIATGCRARSLPGAEGMKSVFTLRSEHDAAMLVHAMEKSEQAAVLVIGGGFLGIEVACSLSEWDCDVVLAYPGDDLLPKLFTPEISDWFERYLTSRGITLLSRSRVERVEHQGDSPRVVFRNGGNLEFDIAVIAVGAEPNIDVLTGGIDLAPAGVSGIECDETLRTSDEDVYAIGDVAAFPTIYGSFGRYEHVDHSRTSARVVVNNVLNTDAHGEEEVYHYLPYFYSNLFADTDEPIGFKFYGSTKGPILIQTGEKDKEEASEESGDDSSEEGTSIKESSVPINFGGYEEGKRWAQGIYFAYDDLINSCTEGIQLCGTVWVTGEQVVTGALLVNGTASQYRKLKSVIVDCVKLDECTNGDPRLVQVSQVSG